VKRENELRRRLRSLSTLGSAVAAMKSLSAHQFREARAALDAMRAYRSGVERLASSSGASLPAGDGQAGLVLLGAELGVCGGYNARLASFAHARRSEAGAGPTLCVGRRTAAMLTRRGVEPLNVSGAPTSVKGITAVLLGLAERMLVLYVTHNLASFDVVSSLFEGVGASRPTVTRLLPIEPLASDQDRPRRRYVSQQHITEAAVRELLYITLYQLLLDALAAEHGARLLATGAAGDWIDERTEHLRRSLAGARREAGTQEMLEIAAGSRGRRRFRSTQDPGGRA
jgi:F-type H+-transporting ATPase subunit gamma